MKIILGLLLFAFVFFHNTQGYESYGAMDQVMMDEPYQYNMAEDKRCIGLVSRF